MHLQILFAVTCSLGATDTGNDLILARDGQALYEIATSPGPSDVEEFAVRELRKYLDRMSGARFEIGGRLADRGKQITVLEGKCASVREERFCVTLDGEHILISGSPGRCLLYAVYTFLERLGCRWLAPGFDFYAGTHEVVPTLRELRFSTQGSIDERPALAIRKLYVEEGHSHTAENLQQLIDWMPKLRFNTLVVPTNYQGAGRVKWDNWREAITPELRKRGITIEVGGHGYQNFISARQEDGKLFDQHPDWFGMTEAGKRTPQQNRVFCTSNKDAIAYLHRNVLAYLKDRPEIQIFDFWPPDGAAWCTCEDCKRLGSPSQRHALLVAQTSDAVHKESPRVRIECIAYASYVEPPEKIAFDKSVLVDLCPISQCFEYQINDPQSNVNAKYAAALKGWTGRFAGDISIYSYYRKYAWACLPIILPHYIQKDLQFYRGIGVHGVSSYAEPGDWFTYELNHYALGHLAWNPDADVDALVREFCSARYGQAADTAREVLMRLEEITRRACNIPSTRLKAPTDYDRFATDVEKCLNEVEQAEQASSANTIQKAHLTRLHLMIQYAQQDIALQRDAANHVSLAERRRKVEMLARFLQEHASDGVFAFHRRLELGSLYQNYGVASTEEIQAVQRKRRQGHAPATTTSSP